PLRPPPHPAGLRIAPPRPGLAVAEDDLLDQRDPVLVGVDVGPDLADAIDGAVVRDVRELADADGVEDLDGVTAAETLEADPPVDVADRQVPAALGIVVGRARGAGFGERGREAVH